MEELNGLSYVQGLARELQELENLEKNLRDSRKDLIPRRVENEVVPEPAEPQKKVVVFALSEFVLAVLINTGLNFLLSYISNGCMTYTQSVKAGYFGYRNISVIWPVGAVIAIPVALIVTTVILRRLRSRDSQQYSQASKEKEEAKRENIEIDRKNEEIRIYNDQIAEKIKNVEHEKARLLKTLRENASWYPEAYFSLDAVNFAIKQIRMGRAKTVKEALVQYSAN